MGCLSVEHTGRAIYVKIMIDQLSQEQKIKSENK